MEIQRRMDHALEGPPGTETDETILESINLLTIFPEEVWLEVLKKLFHPKDLHHLEKSSRLFEKLFHNIKTKVLFPAVIKILFTKCDLEPTDMKTLLLKCRLVCRTWDIGANAVLNNIVNNDDSFEWNNVPIIPFEDINIDFRYYHRPLTFLRHFDDTYAVGNRCPFICSTVSISIGNANSQAFSEYISALLSIFTKYGHNLFRFCATMHLNEEAKNCSDKLSNVWCFEQLRDFLQLMPNLKVLEITCFRSLSEEIVEDLNLSMQTFVFPPLKMLRHLHLESVPSHVCDAMLRSYSHVSMLSIWSSLLHSDFEDWKALYTLHMPNLTDLSFDIDDKKLAKLDFWKVMWPLKTLPLQIFTSKLDWEKLFKILETRWFNTLTELRLNITPCEYYFNYHPTMLLLPSLKLPKLKVLVLSAKNFVSLDFILELKNSLEYLAVHLVYVRPLVDPEPEFEKENVIKFYSFRRNLMDSNIWQLLPKLNMIEYRDYKMGNRDGETIYYRRKRDA